MAQTGYTPISIYYSATTTNVPTAANLVAGELAINTADGKLFYKDSSGVVQVIAGKGGAGVAGGSNTQVQYNSSGSLAGSANMVFDGTNLTVLGSISTTISSKTAQFNAAGGSIYSSYADGTKTWRVGSGIQSAGLFSIYNATDAVTAVNIDSSGNVGIGTSSPSSALTIGAGGAARFNRADNATYNEIKYVTSGDQFYFNQNNNGNYTFNFGGTEKIRFTAAGDIVLAGGNTAANGVGITFPATQSASSDANTLDDYEEGTCTLTMTLGISGTITLTSGAGGDLAYYTKIGRVVTVTAALAIASVSSPLGEIKINGLPFTVFNSNANYTGVSLFASGWAAGATACLQAYANRGSTVMGLDTYIAGASNGAGSYAQAGATLYLSVTYQSA